MGCSVLRSACFKGGSSLARLTSDGVCGGLLLYLGFIGITSQIKKLFGWADGFDMGYIAFVVVFATIVMYAYLEHIRMRWLAIPLGSALAALIAFVMGAPFEFTTEPGVPNLNQCIGGARTPAGRSACRTCTISSRSRLSPCWRWPCGHRTSSVIGCSSSSTIRPRRRRC